MCLCVFFFCCCCALSLASHGWMMHVPPCRAYEEWLGSLKGKAAKLMEKRMERKRQAADQGSSSPSKRAKVAGENGQDSGSEGSSDEEELVRRALEEGGFLSFFAFCSLSFLFFSFLSDNPRGCCLGCAGRAAGLAWEKSGWTMNTRHLSAVSPLA